MCESLPCVCFSKRFFPSKKTRKNRHNMVKHVESADEFNALKKASKPVRVVSFLSFSLRIILLVVVSFLLQTRGFGGQKRGTEC